MQAPGPPELLDNQTMSKKQKSKKQKSIVVNLLHRNLIIRIRDDEHEFKFEWMKFGSKTSIDFDIIVYVPEVFRLYDPHVPKIICQQLDEILRPYFFGLSSSMEINSCLGCWENGQIVWCQKGSIGETNNSLKETFYNHTEIQMYEQCPITVTLPRDLPLKATGAIRMITGIFTHCSFINDKVGNLVRFLPVMLGIPQLCKLESKQLDRFLATMVKMMDIKKPTFKAIRAALEANGFASDLSFVCDSYRGLETLRQQKKTLIRKFKNGSEILCSDYWAIYDQSKECSDIIYDIATQHRDLFDPAFLQQLQQDLLGKKMEFSYFARAASRGQMINFHVTVLRNVDFKNLFFHEEKIEKMKKITFQLGQTMALINGVELYDKSEIAEMYPPLAPFLWREDPTPEQFDALTAFMNQFLDAVYDIPGIDPCTTELEIKKSVD